MNFPPLASFSASSGTRMPVILAAFLGSFALASAAHGQNYQMQGSYPYGNAPVYQTAPAPSSPSYGDGSSYTPEYQQAPYQGPAYQQQRPLYPQTRTPRAPKPNYGTSDYGSPYSQIQPYSYPQNPAQPKEPLYPYGPRPGPPRPSKEYLAEEVSTLKANDRRQDHRIENLESKVREGPVSNGYVPSPPHEKYLRHEVGYGDSMAGIADHYGVSAERIRNANRLSSNHLAPGQVLRIPVGTVRSEVYVSSKEYVGGTYVVQRGDSLGKVAKRCNVSTTALQNANSIRNPDMLVVGQKLTIPGRGGHAPGKNIIAKNTGPKNTGTTSSKGDGARFISKSKSMGTGTGKQVIAKTSSSKNTTVYAPGPPSSTTTASSTSGAIATPTGSRGVTSYRVEPGDTIDSVARTYGTTATEIERKNKLSGSKLPAVGEEIVVPLPGSVSS